MNNVYHHPELEAYLDQTVHPSAKETVMNAFQAMVNQTNSHPYIDQFVENLLTINDEDVLEYQTVHENIVGEMITLIQNNGFIIDETHLPIATLPFLTELLTALNNVSDYEDAIQIDELLSLGNPLKERAIRIVKIINPVLANTPQYESVLYEAIQDVTTNFLRTLTSIIKPKAEEQRSQLKEGESSKLQEYNKACKKLYTYLTNHTTILTRYQDFMSKVRPVIIWYFESNDMKNNFNRFITHLFENIEFNDNHDILDVNMTEYANLIAIFYRIANDNHANLDIDQVIENLPDYSEPSHKDNVFMFSGQVKKLIQTME